MSVVKDVELECETFLPNVMHCEMEFKSLDNLYDYPMDLAISNAVLKDGTEKSISGDMTCYAFHNDSDEDSDSDTTDAETDDVKPKKKKAILPRKFDLKLKKGKGTFTIPKELKVPADRVKEYDGADLYVHCLGEKMDLPEYFGTPKEDDSDSDDEGDLDALLTLHYPKDQGTADATFSFEGAVEAPTRFYTERKIKYSPFGKEIKISASGSKKDLGKGLKIEIDELMFETDGLNLTSGYWNTLELAHVPLPGATMEFGADVNYSNCTVKIEDQKKFDTVLKDGFLPFIKRGEDGKFPTSPDAPRVRAKKGDSVDVVCPRATLLSKKPVPTTMSVQDVNPQYSQRVSSLVSPKLDNSAMMTSIIGVSSIVLASILALY